MADNVVLSAGVGGETCATDDIGGIQYQRVKLSLGADGAAVDAVAGAGAVSTAVQRVTLASDDPAVAALQILDNCISGNEAQVDIVAALPAGANTIGAVNIAAAQTLATVTTVGTVTSVTAIANALPAGNNNIGDVDIASIAAGNNNIGDVDVASIAAGDNNIGNVDVLTVPTDPFGANADAASATGSISAKLRFIAATGIPITGTVTVGSHAVTNAGTFAVQATGAATGGLTIFRSLDIDETEEEIKGTAGTLYFIHAINMVATARFLKFYNATAANVTVGSTTPVLTFPIPANSTTGAGFTVSIPQGLAFGTAITVACTTGVADADTGAPGANDVIINIGYV